MDRAKTWDEIWNNRRISSPDQSQDISLEDMLNADGFDTPTAKLNSVEYWEEYIRGISKKIDLAPGDSVFEIGCGCGAFLYLWYKEGHRVGGIDYSENLISFARHAMKGMDFRVSEAIDLDTEEKYDVVLSNGVFLYFKDYSYARKVVEKMIMKAGKTIAILEIPDLAKKEESERARRAALPEGEYDKKYEGLQHLYFERDWFTQFSDKSGYKIEIFDQDIKGCRNSQFRFNVVMKK
jgi:cyclopropane fatty-acyl-phospholipid synthase-like methyltransferase